MATAKVRLRDAAIRHAIDLHRYSNSVVADVLAVLRKTDADLAAQLALALERASEGEFSVRRLREMLIGVNDLIGSTYQSAKLQLGDELRAFAGYETTYQKLQMATAEDVSPNDPRIAAPSFEQVYAAATARPFQGRLMADWFDGLGSRTQLRLETSVAMGFTEGKTVGEMVREVRGTRAEQYKDGILNVSTREAEAVVRTAVSHTAAVARDEFYTANANIISSLQWVSTLDARTTEECQVRDGLLYSVDDHEPLDSDVPWLAGPGELHWNCRSISVPVVDLGIKLPPLERAAAGGPVAESIRFGDWIKTQPAAVQNDALGKTRADQLRSGKAEFSSFFNDQGRKLSLVELASKQ